MIESALFLEGHGISSFKKSRTAFEEATVITDVDFSVTPLEVLIFNKCEGKYLIFLSVGNGEKTVRIKASALREKILTEIQEGEIQYVLLINNGLFVFVNSYGVLQLARRLKLSGKTLKSHSKKAAGMLYNRLVMGDRETDSKEKETKSKTSQLVLRGEDGFYVFVNLFIQNISLAPALPKVESLIRQTGFTAGYWCITQEETKVILTGKIDSEIIPAIRVTMSDSGRTSTEISYGITNEGGQNPILMGGFKEETLISEISDTVSDFVQSLKKTIGSKDKIPMSRLKDNRISGIIGKKRAEEMLDVIDSDEMVTKEEFFKRAARFNEDVGPIYPVANENLSKVLGAIAYREMEGTTKF